MTISTHWVGDDCTPVHEYPVAKDAPEPPLVHIDLVIKKDDVDKDGQYWDSVAHVDLRPEQAQALRRILYGAQRATWGSRISEEK